MSRCPNLLLLPLRQSWTPAGCSPHPLVYRILESCSEGCSVLRYGVSVPAQHHPAPSKAGHFLLPLLEIRGGSLDPGAGGETETQRGRVGVTRLDWETPRPPTACLSWAPLSPGPGRRTNSRCGVRVWGYGAPAAATSRSSELPNRKRQCGAWAGPPQTP